GGQHRRNHHGDGLQSCGGPAGDRLIHPRDRQPDADQHDHREGQREEHTYAEAQEDPDLTADQGAGAAGKEWDGGERLSSSLLGTTRSGRFWYRVVCTNTSSRQCVMARTCVGNVPAAASVAMTAGSTSGVPVTR